MIHYYLFKPEINFVEDNDYEFASRLKEFNWTQEARDTLINFEGVTLDHTFPRYVISKFGGDSIYLTDISSGCKTILNILSDPDMVYSLNECGNNAIDYIYRIGKDINIYADNIIVNSNLDLQIVCHLQNKVLPVLNIVEALAVLDKEGFYGHNDN